MTSDTTASTAAHERVMLLIDADNVSVDIMEQAVDKLLADHGALHVRRAYCTAESAVANQAVFKRLSIKPMVNLAAGKNSTDIAMAVDALDLVLAERPDVVAIASSDSDFAPLVARLREKGCRVLGFGQQGKTGDETQAAYDDFTVFTHRKTREAPARAAKAVPARALPAKKATRRKSATAAASKAEAAAPPQAAQAPQAPQAEPVAAAPTAEPSTSAAPARAPSRTRAGRTSRTSDRTNDRNDDRNNQRGDDRAGSRPPASRQAGSDRTALRVDMPDKLRQILAALPELLRGETVELRVAAERLRDADLLGPKASSTKLFAPFADQFEMLPEKGPNRVRLRG